MNLPTAYTEILSIVPPAVDAAARDKSCHVVGVIVSVYVPFADRPVPATHPRDIVKFPVPEYHARVHTTVYATQTSRSGSVCSIAPAVPAVWVTRFVPIVHAHPHPRVQFDEPQLNWPFNTSDPQSFIIGEPSSIERS